MSFTLAGSDKRDFINDYIKSRILPIIIGKPYVATLPMYDILKLWGIDDIISSNSSGLKEKVNSRGEMLIIKGFNFENNGSKLSIEIKGTQYWNSDIFEMEPVISGSIKLDEQGIISFDNLSGISFGYSYLRWIKVIPNRGVYFRRSWIKNDYFLDWDYVEKNNECRVGIPKEIETLVGLW